MRNHKPPIKTLRDEFAMAVLTGLLANSNYGDVNVRILAAYEVADEMMAAREQEPTSGKVEK